MIRLITLLVVCVLPTTAIAKDRAVGISKRVVDMVTQKSGPPLLGAVLEKMADGSLKIAVSRDWLLATEPELFKKHLDREQASVKQRIETLLERLDKWMAERIDDKGLIAALKPEHRRLKEQLANISGGKKNLRAEAPQFFILSVNANNIRKVVRKPDRFRQVAGFAWRERLANVETRSAESLVKELRERQVVPAANEMPDLASRLPPQPETADEFAVRQALFEYQFRKPLDFQGTAGLLLKGGEGAANIDPQQLLGQLLNGQGTDALAGLLGGDALGTKTDTADEGIEKAKKTAEQDGVKGFRTITMKHDLARMQVTVTTRFYARIAKDNWKLVHSLDVPFDASKADPDAAAQIKEDPRIKSILGIFEAAGGGNGAIDKAMQFGVATQQAQKNADGKFREFLDKYIRKVDSPALPSGPGGR